MGREAGRRIFREEALERLSSPEQLDDLVVVVDRKGWLALLALAIGALLAVLWAVFGEVLVTVQGQGILAYPRQVVALQSPADGQILALDLQVGATITRGQVIARLNQPALRQRLDQERVRLEELRRRNAELERLGDTRMGLQRQAFAEKRKMLERRIAAARKMAATQERLIETLRRRYRNMQKLLEKNLLSETAILDARLAYIQAQDSREQQLNGLADYRAQLQGLAIEAAELEQKARETGSRRELEIAEAERAIARYEEELSTKGRIVSDYSGRVLEVTATAGQILSAGQRLGAVETEDPEARLMAVAYLPVSSGKKVLAGMPIKVTPATVQRQRFGAILGTVAEVSSFPVTTEAITNVVGNAEVARELAANGSRIELLADLARDPSTPSGYRWTSGRGPQVRVTAGTTILVRITVERRQPLSYVIPILRDWSGV